MIYYYIPDFFNHYNVNLELLRLINNEPEMFYDDFKIGAVFGNFPNCIWNGGRAFFGNYIDADKMSFISNQFNSFQVPLRLTMTNFLLEKIDVYDRYANYIMKNLNNGFNQVLVSSPILEDYIRENYPEYKIIRSILASEEIYYDDSDKYYMSVLNRKKNYDFQLLNNIQNKDKIEILINEVCSEKCEHHHEHYTLENKTQLYNSESVHFCPYLNDVVEYWKFNYKCPLYISREKIKEIYEPMGFQHFKIAGRNSHGSIVLDYAHYMVKPEYKDCFIRDMFEFVIMDNK